ncbi:30S ribosomal protein S4 [bacterium]|nr:30S ribosomal protein S4 [bacterium]
MARSEEAKCRICRREGVKLFLKGDRCHSDKCAFERKPYAPGQHGRDRKRETEYRLQLREKQKVKATYGMLEKQFRIFYHRSDIKRGATGENLLSMLESRLDNVVFRLGLVASRTQARQLINHRHFTVNGIVTDIASFIVSENDEIQVREKSRVKAVFKDSVEEAGNRVEIPSWLELTKDEFKGKVLRTPEREDIVDDIKEHLIVELYSK